METKRIIKIYLLCIFAYQIIFLIEALPLHDIFVIPSSYIRELTREEWEWFLQRTPRPHETEILFVVGLLQKVFVVVFTVGLFQLFLVKRCLLPIRTRWKIMIPLAGCIAYELFLYYVRNQAEHYRMYMTSVSAETYSFVLLVLILIGLTIQKRSKADQGTKEEA